MQERWVKGGKNYGESEVYLKGGDAPSIGAAKETPVEEAVEDEEDEEDEEDVFADATDELAATTEKQDFAPIQANGVQVNGVTNMAVETAAPVVATAQK